jgi:hypothetical protein
MPAVGRFGRWARNRYPSWFRYVAHDRDDTPTLDYLARIFPSSDGTSDAPLDERGNHLFWLVAGAGGLVGVVLIVLAFWADSARPDCRSERDERAAMGHDAACGRRS